MINAARARDIEGSQSADLNKHTKEYRALKQRKQRGYSHNCLKQIEDAYKFNKTSMWKVINKLSADSNNNNYPSGEEFYEFFYNRSQPELNQNFDYNYEKIAIEHLKIEQNKLSLYKTIDSVDLDILNRNFTEDEISCAITKLKRNKSP